MATSTLAPLPIAAGGVGHGPDHRGRAAVESFEVAERLPGGDRQDAGAGRDGGSIGRRHRIHHLRLDRQHHGVRRRAGRQGGGQGVRVGVAMHPRVVRQRRVARLHHVDPVGRAARQPAGQQRHRPSCRSRPGSDARPWQGTSTIGESGPGLRPRRRCPGWRPRSPRRPACRPRSRTGRQDRTAPPRPGRYRPGPPSAPCWRP